MRPERVDESFCREARRLDRLLRIHAEHKHVEDDLKIRLALIIATGTSNGSDWSAALADQVADQGGARALAWRERICMPVLEIEHLAPGAERAPKFGTEDPLAEAHADRRQRD